MTTPKHAPTPWTQHLPTPWQLNLYIGATEIIDAEGFRVLQCHGHHSLPNAKMIVRAVNAHEQLIEALTGLLENIPQPKNVRKDFSLMVYMEAARKALRAAKGE